MRATSSQAGLATLQPQLADLTLTGSPIPGRMCDQWDEGYKCTRRSRHLGDHAAGDGTHIVHTWPQVHTCPEQGCDGRLVRSYRRSPLDAGDSVPYEWCTRCGYEWEG